MTANQVPHDAQPIVLPPATTTNDVPAFEYTGFGRLTYSFRLLTIEPAESGEPDEPLRCRLSHVEFGQDCEYEALSYMWGGDDELFPITLNDRRFQVRRNLLGALRFLRAQRRAHPIWIDAVCINQDDIEERNHQLRLMHHLFDRALTVLVWLGEGYSRFDPLAPVVVLEPPPVEMVEESSVLNADDDGAEIIFDSFSSRKKGKKKKGKTNSMWGVETPQSDEDSYEREFYRAANEDPYWHRLWIIQEVGQAQEVMVCFGSAPPVSWESFVQLITKWSGGTDGPLRLNTLRKERDSGARNFKRLLIDHRRALCTEPRDKIYGLVGLADDAWRLPMDYKKPLLDVWFDVMHFVNAKGLVRGSELISFGGLVRYLLMGSDSSALQNVLGGQHAGDNNDDDDAQGLVWADGDNTEDPAVFSMPGYIIGEVQHVGISTTTVKTKPDAIDDWNEKVHENFKSDAEAANKENRVLRHAIYRPPNLRTCFPYAGPVRWLVDTEIPVEQLREMLNNEGDDDNNSPALLEEGRMTTRQQHSPVQEEPWSPAVQHVTPESPVHWTDAFEFAPTKKSTTKSDGRPVITQYIQHRLGKSITTTTAGVDYFNVGPPQDKEDTREEDEADSGPRLFQMQSRTDRPSPSMMGLASSGVRVGDLIVWLSSTAQALVVRAYETMPLDSHSVQCAPLRIVGSAWTTRDLAPASMASTIKRSLWCKNKYSIPLRMDATTIFVLATQHEVDESGQ